MLRQLLRQSPNYQDAQILLGRIHAWNGHYDSARLVLTPLTSPESFHLEATSALTDVELWDHHPEKALQLTDFGLARDPKNQDLLYRRAKALQMLSRQPEADATLQNLLTLNPGHEQGLALAEIFKEESAKNSVYALYELDAFSKALDSWHTLSLAYTRRLKQGNLIGRAYVANRFEKTGTLVEADFYPKLNDNYYLYLNAGGSTASFFPKFRSGISLFRNMGHGFELEAGLRYLRYAENTVIYTASVSKYWGKFWFSFRPYFSPGQEEIAQSYFLTLRYYYGATDEFLGLTLGSGFSPDDRNKDLSLLPSATLQSSKIRLDVQKKIAPLLLLTGRLGLDYQEYSPSAYRNNYTVGLGLDRRF
ncbi:YaiO family outer membrane beta-barrel protein [Rufibacter sp. DG15C]|uniref:YaiO family outer membrane beta-barrel protein n=1 Tax=Rufibacter sp. DG15C TaxID=1379909 RepID=UPI0018D40004|nr:YaiO family outer membrane beta-barrel protein [Rufibacter sp. DG15C]